MSNIATLPVAQLETTYDVSTAAMVFDPSMLDGFQRLAELMASARATIPKHLVGSVGDCFAVVIQAAQWKMNPYAIAQKTHIINGVLGYEAQLVNAVISSSPLLATRPDYEWYGPWENVLGRFAVRKNADGKEYRVPDWKPEAESGCGVRVRATLRGEAKPRELDLLLTQARTRNSTLWADDPRQQLAYLAIKRWARLHAPDVLLGVYTPDELQEVTERDMGPAQVVESTPSHHVSRTESVKAKLVNKRKAAEPSPDLDDVMFAIASAETPDQLKAAASVAAKLDSDAHKTLARKAYGERKAALERPVEPAPFDLEPPNAVSEILAGIARHDPEDLDVWLDEARAQGITGADLERIESAIAERVAK
jgi:hypothetical protein